MANAHATINKIVGRFIFLIDRLELKMRTKASANTTMATMICFKGTDFKGKSKIGAPCSVVDGAILKLK